MIKGSIRHELSPESILRRITSYDIFRFYMPDKAWKINYVCHSPFHKDDHPSFMIGNRSGDLTFIDFANTEFKGDCFTFVKLLFGLANINDVLLMIDHDFGLGIAGKGDPAKFRKIKAKYEQPEEAGKRYAHIQVITRPFTKDELAYWAQYHQSIDDLRRNNVYSIKKVYLNRKLFTLGEHELRFGYYYDGHWKIYRPLIEKRWKWVPNNVPIGTMEGLELIKGCDFAFINKSKKDKMVVEKLIPTTCAVQNEGIACFTEENVKYLKDNSKRQVLSFDSDVAGVKNSRQITRIFGFDYANVPRNYLDEGIKDWAELARVYGMSTLEKIFKEKGLL